MKQVVFGGRADREVPARAGTRETACRILVNVMDKGAMSTEELKNALDHSSFDDRDRRFVSRLVRGTLENILLLDWSLNRFTREPVKKQRPLLRELLRMGAYQILFMDSVTDAAAVDESVKLAQKLGFRQQKAFINAVLRALCRDRSLPEGPPELLYSVPDYLCGLLKKQYRDDHVSIMRSFQEETPLCVHPLCSRQEREHIRESLTAEDVTVEAVPHIADAWFLSGVRRVDELEAFSRGWIQVQGPGSCLAGSLVSPRPGDRVLDLCAAPGGKTIHLADQMNDEGELFSCDVDGKRLERVRENAVRCGFTCIKLIQADAAVFREEWEGTMDRVLADVPCSGLGTIGHRPEIRYRVNPVFLREMVALQKKILENAWRYLKPGGELVFSTCTINKTENEENYRWLLANFPLEPVPGRGFPEGEDGGNGFLQLLPGKHKGGGFFVSRCRRKDG